MRIEDNGFDAQSKFDNFEVIFNTVPSQIFKKCSISTFKNGALYVEIASAPYGVEVSSAREAGVHIIFAPSIPSKYAPISAGRYIFEAISEILEKRGIIL